MAIRAGSGALKYPLPNQAQIQAQQSAAAASAGGSASASAYGTNRRYAGLKKQLQYNAFESGMDRLFRADQANLDRGFRAEQAYFDREHQKGGQLEAQDAAAKRQAAQFEQQTQLQYESQYNANLEAQRDRDFTTERDAARFEQDRTQFERGIDASIEDGIRTGELELSPEAQFRLQQLEGNKAARTGLDPEQQAEFDQQHEKRRREILRTAKPPSGPSITARANQGQTFYDPQTGTFAEEMGPGRIPGRLDQNEQFVPTVAGDTKADEKQQKQFEYNRKRMEDLVGQPIPNQPGKFYDVESAAEQVQKEQETATGRFGPQSEVAPDAPIETAPAVPGVAAQPADRPMGMGESVQKRSSVAPEQEGLPEGVPEGSAWVDNNTIRYPDGRMFRKKAQPAAQPTAQQGAPESGASGQASDETWNDREQRVQKKFVFDKEQGAWTLDGQVVGRNGPFLQARDPSTGHIRTVYPPGYNSHDDKWMTNG